MADILKDETKSCQPAGESYFTNFWQIREM